MSPDCCPSPVCWVIGVWVVGLIPVDRRKTFISFIFQEKNGMFEKIKEKPKKQQKEQIKIINLKTGRKIPNVVQNNPRNNITTNFTAFPLKSQKKRNRKLPAEGWFSLEFFS